MSNVIDINSGKIIRSDDVSILPNSFCQNNNLSPVSIAVGAYINSKNSSEICTLEVKNHFGFGNTVLEIIFEEFVKEGYLNINVTTDGTRSLTFDFNGPYK